MLPPRQQATVKALRLEKGIRPAIALAKKLGKS
jgi:ribosomal protein L30/L7E